MYMNSASVNNRSAKNDISIILQDRPKTSCYLALIANRSSKDSRAVSALLKLAGYASRRFDSLSQLSEKIADGRVDATQLVAMVVLHGDGEDTGLESNSVPMKLPNTRLIVLTDRYSEEVIVSFLYGGAHHVFNLNERSTILQVRLEAALRQHSRLASKSFSVGDIHFDVPKRRVNRSGMQINLSPKEYDLAYYLFSNRGRVVGNNELMTSIWSLPPSMDTRRIDTAACRLRKKLRLTIDHGWELKRLRCVGYRLIPSDHLGNKLSANCTEPLRVASA